MSTQTKEVTLTVHGMVTRAPECATIMEVADALGINIPRLCYHPHLSILGARRVCLVEVEGMRNPVASCAFPVSEGMKVQTSSALLRRLRRDVVELILDNHPQDCHSCERNGNCELQKKAYELGIPERYFEGERKRFEKDLSSR